MMKNSLTLVAAAAFASVVFATPSATAGDAVPIQTTLLASGLDHTVFVTHAPGDESRLYIVEKQGFIKVLNLNTGEINAELFLNIDAIVFGGTSTNNEQGLLGLAFHPDFGTKNMFFYVNFTGSGGTNIARFTATTRDLADAGSRFTLFLISQPQSNHNGGWMGFGPNDDYLYISTGDGGGANDQHGSIGNAQDITNNLLGKMLRIDVDGDNGGGKGRYGIPKDNPFVDVTGDDEIWAYGLRNPWRPSFDRETGDLWIADVGQGQREEVNFQSAKSPGGENYGWRCMEGFRCTGLTGCTCNVDVVLPILNYLHNGAGGLSITGGYRYRGCDIWGLDGEYFYADYVFQNIWTVNDPDNANPVVRDGEISPSIEGAIVNQVSSFGEDARGEMYIVDQGSGTTGQIFKIIPAFARADFDNDGDIDFENLLQLLSSWGPCAPCREDLNCDGQVSFLDILILLGRWG